jgi:outer membrane protein assembly factor BamB
MSSMKRAAVVGVLGLVVGISDGAAQVRDIPDDFGVTCASLGTGALRWQAAVEEGWPPRLRIAGRALWAGRGERWIRHTLATGTVRPGGEPPAIDPPPDHGFWTTTEAILHDRDGQTHTVITTGAFVDDLDVAAGRLTFTLDRDDGQVYALSLSTGKLAWVVRPRELVAGYEAGDGSRVERIGDRMLIHAPPALIAVDARTGGVAWSVRVPALEGRWGALRVVADDDAWIVAVDGVVVALDPETGEVRWTREAGAGGATAPVIGGGLVCFDHRDEAVVPYQPDEAEVARAVAIEIVDGAPRAARWIGRAEVPAGAPRWPLLELAPDGAAASRLELATVDAALAVDLAPLVGEDRTVYVEVPGVWESAQVVGGAAALEVTSGE